jgi:hypothetical protein
MGSKFNSKVQLKKFKKHFWLGLLGCILVILVLAFLSNPKEEKPQEKKTASATFSAVKPLSVTNADVMSQRLEQYIQEQQKINEQNNKKMAALESENQAYRQDKMEAESKAAAVNAKLTLLNNTKTNSSAPKALPKPQKIVFEDDINSDNSDDGFEKSAKQAAQGSGLLNKTKIEDKSVATYVPSNSFVKGVLIGSLSANTGGNASSDPTPVLIRLTDLAQLPNEFKSNLRSCMVGGSGWGDLSTERVKIRLTTLSCVLKSGKALDIPVDGFIYGEDAKAGIAGLVVSHSGTIAAKATLAGFVQGIGQIGQAMGQTQTITPLGGVTTTISPSQAVQAGVGSGVSQAGSTLSQYYLNMLQQISPAIEVAAGRHVTVVFSKGIELKLPINEQDSDNNEQPLPLS